MYMRLLEMNRQQRKMTQAQIADRLGYSERTYRSYLTGQNTMHPDAKHGIARKLKAPRLALCAISEMDNPFAPRMLDVDLHPALQIRVSCTEFREAITAVESIDPCKPLHKHDLKQVADQVLDVFHAASHLLVALAEASNLDLWEAAQANARKLETRGLLKRDREVAA